jgi:hypothetical protein
MQIDTDMKANRLGVVLSYLGDSWQVVDDLGLHSLAREIEAAIQAVRAAKARLRQG